MAALTQAEAAEILGVSVRTIIRRERSDGDLSIDEWATLARAVHPRNRDAASLIADAIEHTLESLGLEAAPPPGPVAPHAAPTPASVAAGRPRPADRDLAESVVCALADALATSPSAVRAPLLAALDRAASLGMTTDELRAGLRASAPATPPPPDEGPR